MTASERRNAILEVLCFRRFDTVANLAFEFGVTDRTIRNDRLGKTYLKDEQQELLERLLPSLDGKDAEVMKSILKTFGLKGVTK